MLTRSLRTKDAQLGADYPDIAITLHQLGFVKDKQEGYTRAEEMLTRAFRIEKLHLGLDHPDIVLTLQELSSVKEGEEIRQRPLR